jgi:hypothetical protein
MRRKRPFALRLHLRERRRDAFDFGAHRGHCVIELLRRFEEAADDEPRHARLAVRVELVRIAQPGAFLRRDHAVGDELVHDLVAALAIQHVRERSVRTLGVEPCRNVVQSGHRHPPRIGDGALARRESGGAGFVEVGDGVLFRRSALELRVVDDARKQRLLHAGGRSRIDAELRGLRFEERAIGRRAPRITVVDALHDHGAPIAAYNIPLRVGDDRPVRGVRIVGDVELRIELGRRGPVDHLALVFLVRVIAVVGELVLRVPAER